MGDVIPFFIRRYLTTNGRKALMDLSKGFGPTNPRQWDPNHPSLKSGTTPHESRATIRLHRAGWPGNEITKLLKMSATKVMKSMQDGLGEEGQAHRLKRVIYDGPPVPKGTK